MLKNSEYIALFPNVMIGLHIDHFYIFWLEPLATIKPKNICKCIMLEMKVLMVKNLNELRKENAKILERCNVEDISAIEGMQEGRGSPVYNGGNFSPVMDHQLINFING